MKHVVLVTALMAAMFMSGCASKAYKHAGKKNFTVHTKIENTATKNRYGQIAIYSVNKECQIDREGIVFLEKEETKVSLPENKRVYLVYQLTKNTTFLGKFLGKGGSSVITESTILDVQPGVDYKTTLNYIEGMYEFLLHAKAPGSKGYKELPFVGISACQPAK